MIGFAKFMTESAPVSENGNRSLSDGIVRMLGKKVGKKFTFVQSENFTNKLGKQEGYLYVTGTSAVRINFKGNSLQSISRWSKYGGNPDMTVIIMNGGKPMNRTDILAMATDMLNPLAMLTKEDMQVYENGISTPDGNECFSKCICVRAMYDEGWSLESIVWWLSDLDVDEDYVYKCIGLARPKFGTRDIHAEMKEETVSTDMPEETTANTYDTDKVEVCGEIPETVEENPSVKQNEEELAEQLIADPLPIFRQLNTYVLMVARGLNNALLITGQGGIGKSYNVNKILAAYGTKNKDYVIMKGKSSTSAMYKFLYDNYDKIVVFDDCDSVLQDSDGLNILKGVLDSGRVKEVSWNTSGSQMVNTFGCETHEEIEERLQQWSEVHKGREGIPTYFQFQGACIFISNLFKEDMEKSPAMQPLLTRCTAVDIKLMAEDIIYKIESILPHIKIYDNKGKDISDDNMKQEVFDFMKSDEFMKDPRLKGKEKSLSIRLFTKIYMFRYAGLPNWKELAFCL